MRNATKPCSATRLAIFAARESPFFRSHSKASSNEAVEAIAFLQSLIGAPDAARSCLIKWMLALIVGLRLYQLPLPSELLSMPKSIYVASVRELTLFKLYVLNIGHPEPLDTKDTLSKVFGFFYVYYSVSRDI